MSHTRKQQREFAELFSDYFPLLCNIINTKIGNRDDAMDIAQETLTLCYEKMDEIRDPRKWIFGTYRNIIKQYYEKKSKNYDVDIDDVTLTFVNGFRDTRLMLEDAIKNIEFSEEEITIFEYIAYYHYSYSKVGEIMGYGKWSIERRYRKIVKKFDDYFKKIGINSIEDLL